MSALDPKYGPHIEEAREAYIRYLDSLPSEMRALKRADANLKYFDILADYYAGASMKELAHDMGMGHKTLRTRLATAQNKVRNYLTYGY